MRDSKLTADVTRSESMTLRYPKYFGLGLKDCEFERVFAVQILDVDGSRARTRPKI